MLLLPLLTLAASSSILVLQDTGTMRDGLPVFRQHPDAERYERVLKRGYAGRLVRLYALEQRVSHPERDPEPAVLCLTQNQGGFPRDGGFVLDGVTRRAPYVDLHERSALTGRYGAVDQIFPHELMHIILADLAGPRGEGRASQVHAIAVATDRVTAFDEGLAEHAQVMAIDAPDGEPETHRLAVDGDGYARALQATAAYERALTARWSIAPRARIAFPFWFSGAEQVLRYHGVRENRFAREPSIARVTPARAHDAYLLDNVLPGAPDGPRKPLARALATEGVISAFFVRLVTDAVIQRASAPAEMYARFGVSGEALDPIDRAYLKLFAAFARRPHDLPGFVREYAAAVPADDGALRRVTVDVFGGDLPADLPEVWLVNPDMPNGRSLFDQLRGAPRPHAFDLNAASIGDLIGVPGVDVALANAIQRAAPYRSVADLDRVLGTGGAARATMVRMASAAATPNQGRADEGSLTFAAIMKPYARYAAGVWIVCAISAAAVYRAVRSVRWWRAGLNGVTAASIGLVAGWIADGGSGAMGWLAPMLLCAVPAAAAAAWRTRSLAATRIVVAAWALAACVPLLALRPIG